jgi:hypothetical protein
MGKASEDRDPELSEGFTEAVSPPKRRTESEGGKAEVRRAPPGEGRNSTEERQNCAEETAGCDSNIAESPPSRVAGLAIKEALSEADSESPGERARRKEGRIGEDGP